MKKNNRILAIDPGTHYIGVAVLDGTKLVYYGVKTLPLKHRSQDALTEGRKVIRSLIKDFKPGMLAVEKTFFANNRNSVLLNVLVNEILSIGKRERLRVISLAANVVRKEICGNGRAGKQDVAREIVTRFPELKAYLFSDRRWKERYFYNTFDAIALGVAAYSRKVQTTRA